MAVSTQSRCYALDYFHDPNAATHYIAENKTALIGVNHPVTVLAVGVKIGVTTTVDAATCEVTRRVTIGTATGHVDIDTIYIPLGTAAGKVVYIELATPVTCNAGDELSFFFSNNGGAVTWMPWVDAIPREETRANQAHFQLSVDV